MDLDAKRPYVGESQLNVIFQCRLKGLNGDLSLSNISPSQTQLLRQGKGTLMLLKDNVISKR